MAAIDVGLARVALLFEQREVVLFGIVFVLTVAPSMLTPLMVVREFGDDPDSAKVRDVDTVERYIG